MRPLLDRTRLFHRQRDALAVPLEGKDVYRHTVADLDRRLRFFDEFVGELRDVHQAILVGADIDKGPEFREVGDDALDLHADLEFFDRGAAGWAAPVA